MINEKKLLINYLSYILLGLIICFVGVSKVFGATLTGMKFINRTSSQYPFTTTYNPTTYTADYFTFNGDVSTPNYAILNVCGTGVLGFDITNGSGHFDYLGFVEYTDKTCTVNGYAGNEYTYYFGFTQFDDAGNGNVGVSFTNYVYNVSNWTVFANFKSLTFSDSSSLDLLIQQQNLINNSTTNSQNIINNQNSNTQDIINNQNSNTQDIIDSIDSNLTECRESINLFDLATSTSKSYSSTKNELSTNYWIYHPSSDSVDINRTIGTYMEPTLLTAGTYTISFDMTYYSSISFKRYYIMMTYGPFGTTSGQQVIFNSPIVINDVTGSITNHFKYTFIVNSTNYFWLGGYTNSNGNPFLSFSNVMLVKGNREFDYEKYGTTICKNLINGVIDSVDNLKPGLDDISDGISDTKDSIDNLNDSILDSSSPDTDSLNGMAGWLPAGPVDSILNLPLTFLNTLNSNLGTTCSSVTVPIPFVNQSFELPCFSEYMTEHLSSFNILWTLIGGVVSVYILYNYLLGLYKWVDDTLTLRENTMPGYYDDNWGGGA